MIHASFRRIVLGDRRRRRFNKSELILKWVRNRLSFVLQCQPAYADSTSEREIEHHTDGIKS